MVSGHAPQSATPRPSDRLPRTCLQLGIAHVKDNSQCPNQASTIRPSPYLPPRKKQNKSKFLLCWAIRRSQPQIQPPYRSFPRALSYGPGPLVMICSTTGNEIDHSRSKHATARTSDLQARAQGPFLCVDRVSANAFVGHRLCCVALCQGAQRGVEKGAMGARASYELGIV